MKKPAKPFEKSRFDDDRGVREGSKADRKRDAVERKSTRRAKSGAKRGK